MEQLSATRSELIARRLQIGLATQGRDLLKEKRAALVVEFGHLSTGVLEAVEIAGAPGRGECRRFEQCGRV